ncbi:MAG: redoxin domain-containing protein [Opitutae bacterium]|nr:redoxin domain-containing protein [Opitutae bacterium]
MKLPSLRSLVLSALLLAVVSSVSAEEAAFKIGQPAPEFKAGRWVKHGPITRLESGQIYIIEFWATWCSPCRAAMPHLTKLAHEYKGKLTVIGVDLFERLPGPEADRAVDKVIAQMGKDADYPICRDTADDDLLKNWFNPTKAAGIPTSIVVDAAGKIAWISSGMPFELDRVVKELLAGEFDYAKSAADFAGDPGNQETMLKVMEKYGEAMQAKDWRKAMDVWAEYPTFAAKMPAMRFRSLVKFDAKQAFAEAQAAVEKSQRDPSDLLQRTTVQAYLSVLLETDELPKEMYAYALENLKADAKGNVFFALAQGAWRLGEAAQAAEYQAKFRDYLHDLPNKVGQQLLDQVDADLAKYQEAVRRKSAN